MSLRESRIDKLFPALTAKERGILVLQAWKQGTEEDPLVRQTMPPEQGAEFNRYIGLMNSVHDLTPYILGLRTLMDQLGLRFALLRTLDLWAMHALTLAEYIWSHTEEPITESELRRRTDDARAEVVPAAKLAEILVERHGGWSDDDLVPAEDGEEPVVSDVAWERVLTDKKKKLARLASEGIITGKRRGRRLMVNAGSFYDWIGERVPVSPDWGLKLDVRSDAEANEVERLRRARRRAQDALVRAPSITEFVRDVAAGNGKQPKAKPSWGDEIVEALTTRIREETRQRWGELLATEKVFQEVAVEFDGEDPLLPDVRCILDDVKREIEELGQDIQGRLGPLDLGEPDAVTLDRLRVVIKREPG